MKIKKIAVCGALAGILIGVFVCSMIYTYRIGYKSGTMEDMRYENGTLYTERDIGILSNSGDFDTIQKIFQHIEIEGIEIHGSIVSINIEDVRDISERVKQIENVDPILSIRVLSAVEVEVCTGVVYGPLNGGGTYYRLKKEDGEWDLLDTGYSSVWVS